MIDWTNVNEIWTNVDEIWANVDEIWANVNKIWTNVNEIWKNDDLLDLNNYGSIRFKHMKIYEIRTKEDLRNSNNAIS